MSGRRIGILTHSTNPRGGVVHAMQLAEALCDLGEDATLLAPAAAGSAPAMAGSGFFRATRCEAIGIPASPAVRDVERLVATRRGEVAAFLRAPGTPQFDILHAQDPISALALSDLVDEGRIRGFLRTVHHLDDFSSPLLSSWQDRAVRRAAGLFCVSRLWQSELQRRFGRASTLVGNGVDTRRFTPERDAPERDAHDTQSKDRVVLALGGVEARKNTLGTLRAFLHVMRQGRHPDLRLVVAGGASLLDHSSARRAFDEVLRGSPHADRVQLAGVIDDAAMPSLYRGAAMLCFPSLQEGFGLCVIEAMASGIPVIVPRGAPFDEYLHAGDAILADPLSDLSIADAMLRALRPEAVRHARANGPTRARQFDWRHVAARHALQYDLQPETQNA